MTDPADISFADFEPDPLEAAHGSIASLRAAFDSIGLHYGDLPDTPVSANLVLGFGEDGYVLVSVLSGAGSMAYLSTGGRADLQQDRRTVLELCNALNKENPAITVYLQDDEPGWDLIVQQAYPVRLLLENPEYLGSVVRANIARAKAVGDVVTEQTSLGGRPYATDGEDLQRLAARAVL